MRVQSTLWRGPLALALAALVWAPTGPAQAQLIDVVRTATPNSSPTDTYTGSDGTIWFVEETGNRIGTITPGRTAIGEVNLVIPNSRPTAITVDTQGKAWFTMAGVNKIGQYTRQTNSLVEYQLPGANLGLSGISVDSTGKIWFTEKFTDRIGILDWSRLTVQYVDWQGNNLGLHDIVCHPSGYTYFTQNQSNKIGQFQFGWDYIYDYTAPIQGPYGIDTGFQNDIWFTEQTSGHVTQFDPFSGSMFQFDTWGGTASQPKYLDTWQLQGQSYVSWTESAPGQSQIGLLNPYSGGKTQIQATSPFAQPTGVSYGYDQTLWWTETASSQLTGWYFNSSIVSRPRGVGDPIFASLDAATRVLDGFRMDLTRPDSRLRGGRMILASLDKKPARVSTVSVTAKRSRPSLTGQVRLASLGEADDRPQVRLASLGEEEEGTVQLAQFNPVGGTPLQTQKQQQTAIIDVIQVTQNQYSPQLQYRMIPTNADMKILTIGTGTVNHDQGTINVGECATLQLLVKFRTGAFIDVTNDPNTRFFLDPPRGNFTSKNVWCPGPDDANKVLTVYGYHYSPSGQQSIKDTVIIRVNRNDGR
jgi:streptogramin lyase